MANARIFAEHWKELKGKVKPRWMALSDSDVSAIEGNLDVLLEFLREKYGLTQVQAQADVERFMEENGLMPATAT